MTRRPPTETRASALVLALLTALALSHGEARAQATDCSALRAALDDAGRPPDPGRYDAAMRQQRDEILRMRTAADQTGCGDGVFDDPESAPCRALTRRMETLRVGLQRLQDQAFRGDPAGDEHRRDLQARFDAECAANGAGDVPVTTEPVDPEAPPGPAATPKASRVLCVRHCDGAYYPLAVDVATDRMGDMDRICQAQCPAAESSAYADGGDVADATATDGSSYASLPAAFGYLKGPSKAACACRAPHQSWAEALAGAEALLPPHKGDVTVTAEISAAMARPVAAPQKPVPAVAKPAAPRKPKAKPAPALIVPSPLPDRDLTREFRGSDPTL